MLSLEERQAEEIETLREKVRQLEAQLVPPSLKIPPEWLLTAREASVFAHLVSRDEVTKQSIMDALYSGQAGDAPEIKIVDVFVCKLRKKVKPFGVVIGTIWGRGYALADRHLYASARTA